MISENFNFKILIQKTIKRENCPNYTSVCNSRITNSKNGNLKQKEITQNDQESENGDIRNGFG